MTRILRNSVPPPEGWTSKDLDRALAAAAAAWPDLTAPDDGFVEHLRTRTPALPPDLDPARAADLYLAYRCGEQDDQAIAALEAEHRRAISISVSRVDSQKHSPADLGQIVRQHLFVGPKRAITSYNGRGSLSAWLGVVALRTALNAARGNQRQSVPIEEPADLGDIEDPELDFLRDKYKADFRAAFDRAALQLTQRERLLLRQHMVEKLTVRELGTIYGVNSGTVSRWIVRARDGLAERTCAELKDELSVSEEELQSIIHLIRSRVELSLTRALAR